MRELNEAEKELCNQILEEGSDYFSIASLLDKHLPSISIKPKKPDEVTVSLSAEHIDLEDLEKIQSKMSYTGSLILAAVNLFGMLEREGYILFIQRVPYTDDEFGQDYQRRPGPRLVGQLRSGQREREHAGLCRHAR